MSFPDFPDCVSTGRTIAEARQNAQHALAVQCWRLHHDGAPLPAPSFMHQIGSGRERPEGLVVLITPPSGAA